MTHNPHVQDIYAVSGFSSLTYFDFSVPDACLPNFLLEGGYLGAFAMGSVNMLHVNGGREKRGKGGLIRVAYYRVYKCMAFKDNTSL